MVIYVRIQDGTGARGHWGNVFTHKKGKRAQGQEGTGVINVCIQRARGHKGTRATLRSQAAHFTHESRILLTSYSFYSRSTHFTHKLLILLTSYSFLLTSYSRVTH